jgi:AbrB family looped-hinge helix DNA binding protein
MPTATLTSKGQITLPKAIRQRLRVHTGDAIEFTIGADGEIRVRAGNVDVSALRGLLRRSDRGPVSIERMNDVIRRAAGRR